MKTKTLLDIIETRIQACENNPTELEFLTEMKRRLMYLDEKEAWLQKMLRQGAAIEDLMYHFKEI